MYIVKVWAKVFLVMNYIWVENLSAIFISIIIFNGTWFYFEKYFLFNTIIDTFIDIL